MALTQKQEAFCIAYMETSNATESYRRAYDTSKMNPATINRCAKDVIDNPKITARLVELRAPIIAKTQITVEDLLAELEEARKMAIDTEAPGPAVSATMGKAKLLGMDKQVVELTGKNGGAIITKVERVIVDA